MAEPPVDVRNGAGDAITLFPTNVVVDDVIWSDAELDPQHRIVAPMSLRALDSRDIALAGQSVRDRDLIVGLQPRLQIPSEDIDYDFIVTFVAGVSNDGRWSILGPLAERLNIEAATLQAHLGLGLVDMVRTARSEYLASSEQTTVAYEAMIASLTEPDPASSWDKLDPTERDLTLTEIPSSLRGEVEAIGIEVVVSDAATTVDDQLVSVRSQLGRSLQFQPTIGSNVALVLRGPGEALEIVVVSPEGSERSLGVISGVRAGQVAVLDVSVGDSGELRVEVADVRSPTKIEVHLAASQGVNENGQLTEEG